MSPLQTPKRLATSGVALVLPALLATCQLDKLLRSPAGAPAGGSQEPGPLPPETRLAFTAQPSNAAAGTALSPAIEVRALDTADQTVEEFGGSVTISLASNPTGAALSGDLTVVAVDGIAVFPDLSVDRPGSGYRLAASASGVAGATSASFDITETPPPPPPPSAAGLVFVVQPTDTRAGEAITPAVAVAAVDSDGNTVSDFTGTITMALGSNPGGGTLSGDRTVSAASGVATFSGLSVNRTGDGYTLRASASGLDGATSGSFAVAPGRVAELVFTVQPSDAGVNQPISPPVEVTAYDALGNRVTTFDGTVTMSIATDASLLGNARLTGTVSVTADRGVAVFSDLRIDQVGVGYRLRASTGSASAVSSTFTILL
jgi:hypothetical protein